MINSEVTSPLSPPSLSIEAAQTILKRFDCLTKATIASDVEKFQLQQALLTLVEQTDYQMLGICADTLAQGCEALEHYAKALGHAELNLNLAAIEGAVYIKFNSKSGNCYADSYIGEHRGVLVSCQSADEDGINAMVGHLPLELFA